MRRLPVFLLLLTAVSLRAEDASAPQAPASEPALTPSELAQSRELQELVTDERALYVEFAKDEVKTETQRLPDAEKERRMKAIITRYDALLRENPDNVDALILYGKCLRRVGQRDLAFTTFLRADRLSPNLAVVKHQMAAHLAEDGKAADALPLFRRAIELAPGEARYRYDYGEFLAATTQLSSIGGPTAREVADRDMLEAFASASRLDPKEPAYRWRAAAAWYDVKKPDARLALDAWTAIANDARTPEEKEVTGLHRARWLVELGRVDEARKLIRSSTTPSLDATRKKLLDDIEKREPGFREIDKDPTRKQK